MIDINGLTAGYNGRTVLDDVNLFIGERERCALVGHNGAGKSTLLHSMLGLHPVMRGTVTFRGLSHRREGWKKHVAYLPEKFQLYPHLTGLENMRFFAAAASHGAEDAERMEQCLRKVNLWDNREKQAGSYSKGMLQRLGLGLMLYFDTDILILDEPTSGLDPEGRAVIISILRELTDKTILFASHHMDEIRAVCTHAAVLKDGKATRLPIEQFLRQAEGGTTPCD